MKRDIFLNQLPQIIPVTRQRRGVFKWTPPNLPRWYADIPKAVLFVVARQLAAQVAGECDNLRLGERGILDEWRAQYTAGNVPQKPCDSR